MDLATRVLLSRAEWQGAVAALVGIRWRRWGGKPLSIKVGWRCRSGTDCSWRCLYFWDVVVEFLDFIIIDIIVRGVATGHCVGRVVDLSEWGKVSSVTRNVTRNVTRKSGK